ncbi:hypothetical protein [Alcanivorax sp. S71-1-4]|uniref:hypothetical protein n=1 Tax=Alcanivorax sp. S71-1-4 TaxID=1177159 RepID=UPI001359C96B|nr:hypothetical protein [Alcanivorax sp. S71-1-4]
MKAISKGLLGAALLATFGISQASPIYYTVNGGATQQLDAAAITDTFSGSTVLTSGICSLNCTLSATGTLSDDGTNVSLAVTSASVTGGFLCGGVTLSGFPWTDSIAHASVPTGNPLPDVDFTLTGVNVNSLCGSCSDEIDVTFRSTGGGQFVFADTIEPNGSCSVTGNLTSSNYYTAWH